MSDLNQEITIYTGEVVNETALLPYGAVDIEKAMIDAWLEVKGRKSDKTKAAYELTMRLFREMLQERGLDVFSQLEAVTKVAEDFVVKSYDKLGRVKGKLSEGTINQRRAILSSFYVYAHKYNKRVENPMDLVDKQDRNVHNAASHIDPTDVEYLLSQMARSSLADKRDYALLRLALTTGRRALELASLTWGDIRFSGKGMEVTFLCKGNKTMRDNLGKPTREALEAYLHALYGANLGSLSNDTPIFVSLSRNNYGRALSTQALSDICEKRLGFSQFHTTRHTFAMSMKKAGANITDISQRLGHADEKTTRAYIAQQESAVNKHINKLEALYGA